MVVAVSFFLYQHTVNLLTNNLRERIESIARSAAPLFDPQDILELQTESDWQKPAWERVAKQLLAVEQNNKDILFAYIFRKRATDPTLMEFVADSHSLNPYANIDDDLTNDIDANHDGVIEPDGPDLLQWPGQDYNEPPEGTFRAYAGPTTSKELYEDSFGRVITGYAPILENGETIAVAAFDMKADDFFTITRQTLYPFLAFISFLVLIILSLFYFIIRMWGRQVQKEVRQRERIEGLVAELGKSNDKLWIANEKLKELDKQKSEFVSIGSHQLRTPLTSIKGYSSMILEGSFGKVPSRLAEIIDRIFQSSRKLESVIEDYLNITRIELGTMKYQIGPVDLKTLTENLVKEAGPAVTRNKLTISFEAAPLPAGETYTVQADSGKLSQVISNLIDNAVKYTPAGSITVKLEKTACKTRLAVTDTGIGLAPTTMPKLFEKFSRADDAGKVNIQGTGLGLYVAKQIIESKEHHGRIWVESAGEGKGSTFFVELG